jgi:hypothetical protein
VISRLRSCTPPPVLAACMPEMAMSFLFPAQATRSPAFTAHSRVCRLLSANARKRANLSPSRLSKTTQTTRARPK